MSRSLLSLSLSFVGSSSFCVMAIFCVRPVVNYRLDKTKRKGRKQHVYIESAAGACNDRGREPL